MATKDAAAIRKRTQIAKANRVMFIWVAIVSAFASFALVSSIFLVQKLVFNQKVINEKQTTVSTLKKNNSAVSDLESEVRALNSNQALSSVKANSDDKAIQVILDALPSEANSLAFGASLQNKLLANIDGLTIDTLRVDAVAGVESSTDSSTQDASASVPDGLSEITFTFSVTGSDTALHEVLTRLERSIRTIDITSLSVENRGTQQVLNVQGRTFYQPAQTVELREKVVKP